MPNLEPQIDLTVIDFPTDNLSIKELRRRLAEIADPRERFRRAVRLGEGLMLTVNSEMRLSQWAFDEALGKPLVEQYPGERDEIRETTAAEYSGRILHIASGEHHADQLVRGLEQAAAEQARRHLKGRQP